MYAERMTYLGVPLEVRYEATHAHPVAKQCSSFGPLLYSRKFATKKVAKALVLRSDVLDDTWTKQRYETFYVDATKWEY